MKSSKRFLALIGMLVMSLSVFAQEKVVLSYSDWLAKGKEAESKRQYISAMAAYWEAMEIDHTENAQEALEAYTKIYSAIEKGKPSPEDKEFDEFDMYDGWLDLYNDYKAYWKSESPAMFEVSIYKRGELDMATKTASYNTTVGMKYNKKYNAFKSAISSGLDMSYRNDWTDIPKDWENELEKTFAVFNFKEYKVQLAFLDEEENVLFTGEQSNIVDYNYYSYYTYTFKGVSRDLMKQIDAGKAKLAIVGVWNSDKELSGVKYAIENVANTNINVVANTRSALLKEILPEEFVTVKNDSTSLLVMKTEMPKCIYEAIMGENPSKFKGENNPVEMVSWYDAIYFCNKLSEKIGLTPVYAVDGKTDVSAWNYTPHKEKSIRGEITQNESADGFRLPTLEEWQYAAKGGEDYEYAGSDNIDEVAWYNDNSGRTTHPVAQKKPNAYGLYDMSGNVWEWVWDSNDYYHSRYNCGGSWGNDDYDCKVSSYDYDGDYPSSRGSNLGFRIVRQVSE